MASPAQIASNRANAQKSTGPSTVAGKSVSRFNALKSGIHAKSMVIPDEDPAELDALVANYQIQFQPITPVEQFLVDRLVDADWQLRRYRKIEAQHLHRELFFAERGEELGPGDRLHRVHRRIDAAERSYFRSLKEIERQIENRSPIAEPVPIESIEVNSELGSFRQTVAVAAATASELRPEGAAAPASRRYEPKENLALRL